MVANCQSCFSTVNLYERTPPCGVAPRRTRPPHHCHVAGGLHFALGLVVLWPTPVDAAANGLIRRVLSALHRAGMPGWFDYNLIESGANVVMFIPLGLTDRPVAAIRLALAHAGRSVVFSAAIEWCQQSFLPGRQRPCRTSG